MNIIEAHINYEIEDRIIFEDYIQFLSSYNFNGKEISKIKDNIQIPKEYINKIYYNLLKEEDEGINPKPKYNYMKEQAKIFPNYGFEKHVGYGTKYHIEQLKKWGVSSIHRKNFEPVSSLVKAQNYQETETNYINT